MPLQPIEPDKNTSKPPEIRVPAYSTQSSIIVPHHVNLNDSLSPNKVESLPVTEVKAEGNKFSKLFIKYGWGSVKAALRTLNVPGRIMEMKESYVEWKAVKNKDETAAAENPKAITGLLSKKLMLSLAISESTVYCTGWLLNLGIQAITKSAPKAIWGMAFGNYATAILAFDVAWWKANRDFYKSQSDTFGGKAWAFLKDIVPIHLAACAVGLPCTYVAGKLSVRVAAGLVTLLPGVTIPSFIYSVGIFALCEFAPFMLAASSLMLLLAKRFTPKYQSYLRKKSETKPI